jgi:hypothetical protein
MDANDYNAQLQAKIVEVENYKKALEQEFVTKQNDDDALRSDARKSFIQNVPEIAKRIVLLALGQVPETSPATQLKAAMYVYDRVVQDTDDPDLTEMDKMLDKLKAGPEAEAQPSAKGTSSTSRRKRI